MLFIGNKNGKFIGTTPVVKGGSSLLIRNIKKLLKSGKSKKPPVQSHNEELKPEDILYESFGENIEIQANLK